MVISSRHPVHGVLFLILAFSSATGLFLLLGAEYIAWIMVIVYVGAVAVLFLFVVMMLKADFASLKRGFLVYFPLGLSVGGLLAVELIVGLRVWFLPSAEKEAHSSPFFLPPEGSVKALGHLLYTHYIFVFQGVGLILLVAMIGAIVLTLRPSSTKRQYQQALRRSSIRIVQVDFHKGIDL